MRLQVQCGVWGPSLQEGWAEDMTQGPLGKVLWDGRNEYLHEHTRKWPCEMSYILLSVYWGHALAPQNPIFRHFSQFSHSQLIQVWFWGETHVRILILGLACVSKRAGKTYSCIDPAPEKPQGSNLSPTDQMWGYSLGEFISSLSGDRFPAGASPSWTVCDTTKEHCSPWGWYRDTSHITSVPSYSSAEFPSQTSSRDTKTLGVVTPAHLPDSLKLRSVVGTLQQKWAGLVKRDKDEAERGQCANMRSTLLFWHKLCLGVSGCSQVCHKWRWQQGLSAKSSGRTESEFLMSQSTARDTRGHAWEGCGSWCLWPSKAQYPELISVHLPSWLRGRCEELDLW